MSSYRANPTRTGGMETEAKPGFRLRYFFLLLGTLLLTLSLLSHQSSDFAVLSGGNDGIALNYIGSLGAFVAAALLLCFGLASYVLLGLLILGCIRAFLPMTGRKHGGVWGGVLIMVGAVILFALSPQTFVEQTDVLGIGRIESPESALSGGVLGQLLASPSTVDAPSGILRLWIGAVGSAIVGAAFVMAGLILLYVADWHWIVKWIFSRRPERNIAEGAGPGELQVQPERIWGHVSDFIRDLRARAERREAAAREKALAQEEERRIQEETRRAEEVQRAAEAAQRAAEAARALQQQQLARQAEQAKVLAAQAQQLAEQLSQTPGALNVPAGIATSSSPTLTAEPSRPVATTKVDPPPAIMIQESSAVVETEEDIEMTNTQPTGNSSGHPASFTPQHTGNEVLRRGNSPAIGLPVPNTEPVIEGEAVKAAPLGEFTLPPVAMLSKGEEGPGEDPAFLEDAKFRLQRTLDSFKVEGEVVSSVSGPRVTRFEIKLQPGGLVNRIAQLSNNIALELEAKQVRILAPVPGRNVVGIEIPNSNPQAVFLRSVMESPEWLHSNAEIPIVLGKDVSGKAIVLDLARAPHLLIAGATGSGKSVCMNTLIMSLLFHFKPDELRLILVDPKVVEMEAYGTLPQLITPVINDPEKIVRALAWSVLEMERRYRVLADAHCKNLKEFNSRRPDQLGGFDRNNEPIPDKMPVLVIILDELADIMMTGSKAEVETSIAKIAQKGRAAGIHLVIATQRPSCQIITGVIKANQPTRIAFQVSSSVDSRVILDKQGAETLLGRGDMLFIPPGCADLARIQGAMVSDDDIAKVVEFISAQAPQVFNDSVVASPEEIEEDGGMGEGASIDDTPDFDPIVEKYLEPGDSELVGKALEIILRERQASTSYLQRRLRIGYNRAADLIDLFEERGIVGPPQQGGSKRDILVFDDVTGE